MKRPWLRWSTPTADFWSGIPDPARGQFSSLQVGLQDVLNRGRDAAMITLVDRPPVRAATLTTLLAAFESGRRTKNGLCSRNMAANMDIPFWLGREMIEAFLRAPADYDRPRHLNTSICRISNMSPVDDPLVAMNVDTPQDYAALRPVYRADARPLYRSAKVCHSG